MNALATGQFGRTVILREVAEAVSDSAGEVAQRQSTQRHHVQAFQGPSQAALGYALSLAVCLGNDAGARRLCTIQTLNWLLGDMVRCHHRPNLGKACFSSPQRGFEISFKHITMLSKGGKRDMHLLTLTTFHQ
ncbi:hypothetical protein COCCADRAFT_41553 [Bipolaris zeicola 26-R-13]|uniref:Uncharacterized protein n=1 Tax=Cochliobolus carbonum (strain 26-R-13) TaxID=930089 RepID=W6XYM7_COCC2|nr:uncharacterized protein COCCADRAFT_41553 [Bipolaris zeicola 26-R-13]EUC27809.1 hypothetical protein COCCADRAFT_41553 [Bipolaris zeicola 26-R-13]